MTADPTETRGSPPSRGRAWWLREALTADPGEPCPPLDRDLDVDVVVLGGGYTGMWTAWHLKRLDKRRRRAKDPSGRASRRDGSR